jgi:sensor c-di-GMP phosphodiesterase-like protein
MTITITSVSARAAKRALERLAKFNGMIYNGPHIATGNNIIGMILNVNEVNIKSTYFTECSLLEIARSVSGRGSVKTTSRSEDQINLLYRTLQAEDSL